jgi:hypothetical protein
MTLDALQRSFERSSAKRQLEIIWFVRLNRAARGILENKARTEALRGASARNPVCGNLTMHIRQRAESCVLEEFFGLRGHHFRGVYASARSHVELHQYAPLHVLD